MHSLVGLLADVRGQEAQSRAVRHPTQVVGTPGPGPPGQLMWEQQGVRRSLRVRELGEAQSGPIYKDPPHTPAAGVILRLCNVDALHREDPGLSFGRRVRGSIGVANRGYGLHDPRSRFRSPRACQSCKCSELCFLLRPQTRSCAGCARARSRLLASSWVASLCADVLVVCSG